MVLTVPDGRIDYSRYHLNFWSPESWRIFVTDAAPGHRISFDRFRVRESAHYENNLAIIHRVGAEQERGMPVNEPTRRH
jgi:hypothetical protein